MFEKYYIKIEKLSNDSKWEPEKAENNTNLEEKVQQPWKKTLEQSKEIKQNWTGAENFDNIFCLFFNNFSCSFSSVYFDPILVFP